jgi:alanine racemase
MELLRKTRAEVYLDNIEHNLLAFRQTMKPRVKIAAVVKANAYGHDIVKVTELLLENSVDCIAVATLQEAAQLRRKFPSAPILVMGFTPNDHLEYAVAKGITLTVFSLDQCRILSQRAQELNKTAVVHIKIDTGFNRLGYRNHDLALAEITAISKLKGVYIQGIFSHLALNSAETDEEQYQQLMNLVYKLEDMGVLIPIKHICDSIGAVAYPQYHLEMVRLGALLYGYCSRETSFELKPAMTLCTEVSMLKTIKKGEGVSYSFLYTAQADTKIATLPIGYADGLPRNIWKEGHVMINGKPAKFAGLPCMDQCMVDVTDHENIDVGDEVILFGVSGSNELSLNDLSKWCGTNKNELLARVSSRVPRVYFRNGQIVAIVDYLVE